MQVHICDAKPCGQQIPVDKIRQVTILGKVYDLCEVCAASFEAWAKDNLDNGRELVPPSGNLGTWIAPYTITTVPDPTIPDGRRWEVTWASTSAPEMNFALSDGTEGTMRHFGPVFGSGRTQ